MFDKNLHIKLADRTKWNIWHHDINKHIHFIDVESIINFPLVVRVGDIVSIETIISPTNIYRENIVYSIIGNDEVTIDGNILQNINNTGTINISVEITDGINEMHHCPEDKPDDGEYYLGSDIRYHLVPNISIPDLFS